MTRRGGQSGSASITVLVLLVFCAAVAAGGILVLEATLLRERRSVNANDQRKALSAEAERVIALLANDPTPQSDSHVDPVWGELLTPALEGATVVLKDVSSALDPNWVQKNVFTKTGLKTLLMGESAAEALQQRREDKGFSTDIVSEYGDLFADKALETYFTAYGYPNINVTDEFALRALYALRTGDPSGAETFHARIQQLLAEKKLLKPDQLQAFFGADYDKLFPIMNAEPIMNAHFIDPLVLRALLAYPDLKVPQPAQSAASILDARDSAELSLEALHGLIGAPAESRIYQYIGVTTWFWKIGVTKGTAHAETIVARIPAEADVPRRYVIVEQRFTP